MNIQPSTRPVEAINNAKLLVKNRSSTEEWKRLSSAEISQLRHFLDEGNQRLLAATDAQQIAHIQNLLSDIRNSIISLDQGDAMRQPSTNDWVMAAPAPQKRQLQLTPIAVGIAVVTSLAFFCNSAITSIRSPAANTHSAAPQPAPTISRAQVQLLPSDIDRVRVIATKTFDNNEIVVSVSGSTIALEEFKERGVNDVGIGFFLMRSQQAIPLIFNASNADTLRIIYSGYIRDEYGNDRRINAIVITVTKTLANKAKWDKLLSEQFIALLKNRADGSSILFHEAIKNYN